MKTVKKKKEGFNRDQNHIRRFINKGQVIKATKRQVRENFHRDESNRGKIIPQWCISDY